MKRFVLLLSLVLLSGCGGGQSDFRPSLIGNWRVRSFTVRVPVDQIKDPDNIQPNEDGTPINCPSNLSAANFLPSCTANSIFQFREDGTATDPGGNIRAYSRKGLFVTYYTPEPTTIQIVFSGNDNVLTWTQAGTETLPAVSLIMERQ